MTRSTPLAPAAPRTPEATLLWVGVVLWLVVLLLSWPPALSFDDEVAYLGQAKLFLAGQIRPQADSPGLWFPGASGLRAQYPLFHPLLLTPLMAVDPRLVFLLSTLSAVGVTWLASRVLRAWGRHPAWALVILAHPTVVILSRTAMADLPFALAAVGAWWALTRGPLVAATVALAGLVLLKVPGSVLAVMLVGGCAFGWWKTGQLGRSETRRRLTVAALALVLGMALAAGLNLLALGHPWFGYDHSGLDTPLFGLLHLRTSGAAHLLSVLLCPPLLIVGAWSYWKRAEFGPLCAIFGFGALMSVYYFVDTIPGWAQSVIVSQRLIVPAVAFLLIGYADLLAAAATRLRVPASRALLPLLGLVVGVAVAVSERHLRRQEPMAAALAAADAAVRAVSADELAITPEASKVGMLYPGRTRRFVPGTGHPAVILCGRKSASYRRADRTDVCDFPGYRTERSMNGFDILVPERASNDAPR